MRITLIQAEIELAIHSYVLSQIAVKDGQEITIEFKNTRGEDGATAEINISSPSPVALGNAQQATQTSSVAETTKTAQKTQETSPALSVAPKTNTTAPVKEAPAQTASISSGEERVDPAVNQQEEVAAVPEAEDEAVAVVPIKSLFANLTKPVNPKS